MKKTVLSYLVAAVVYTLNIAAAFITAINCGREGYDNRTAWIIFFILLLIVGLYLVRDGSAQRFLGQILVTISTTGIFSTLIYDPHCFQVNYFGRNVSAVVCIFAEALLNISPILFVMFLIFNLLYIHTNNITETIALAGGATLGSTLGSALGSILMPNSDSSPSEKLLMLIAWIYVFAAIILIANLTQKRIATQQCGHARRYAYAGQHGYALSIVVLSACALIVAL